MRYYPVMDFDINSIITMFDKNNTYKEEGELVLAHDGLYKYEKGGLYVYKINRENTTNIILDNFIDNITFIKTDDLWERKREAFNIPYLNTIVNYKIFNFSLGPKGETKFIVEKINDSINYYFKTDESKLNECDNGANINFFIKQDICLFLKKLK